MLREKWIYKVVFPGGESGYEKSNNPLERSTGAVPTLSQLVRMINEDMLREDIKKNCDGLVIHFQPPHDLEITIELTPRLCLPLNKKEVQEVFHLISSLI